MTFSKITPSLFTIKEGSTFSPSPSSSGSGDVAGDAIALPEFWSASGACALKGWLEVPTQQSCDCLCGVNRLAESLLVKLCSARLYTEGGGDGGEDGDEEVDDGFPIFFFHVISDFDV